MTPEYMADTLGANDTIDPRVRVSMLHIFRTPKEFPGRGSALSLMELSEFRSTIPILLAKKGNCPLDIKGVPPEGHRPATSS